MEVFRLSADQALRPDQVDTGWSRMIHRGPRTLAEVLGAASAAMDEQDRQRQWPPTPWRGYGRTGRGTHC